MMMMMTSVMISPLRRLSLGRWNAEGKTYIILLLKLKNQINHFNDDDDDISNDFTSPQSQPW